MNTLNTFILNNEALIRITFFVSIIFIMFFLEVFIPQRKLKIKKQKRWFSNFLLVFLGSFLVKLFLPFAAIGAAILAYEKNIGLFSYLELPYFLEILLSVVLLDLLIYFQHRYFHKNTFFWKFHKVHHSDMDYDLSTALRFHPVEILFSMIIKIAAILILGAPLLAVFIFEIILSSLAVFNHSNIRLNKSFDKYLRFLIVTPDMHRIHHSVHKEELNSNYGFNISFWDKIFSSYTAKPKDEYETMTIGLANLQDKKQMTNILSLLNLPFLSEKK
ncbi:MAG: sterol desaturase family protein [Campylobacteraceae bacterium]|nr:sterol desaturase family protein [Campylobacteraceae bacterium]